MSDDVFQRDDEHQRPGDHRENAENPRLADAVYVGKTLSDGIEGGCADIAVDNTQRRDGQVLTDRSRSRCVNYGRIRHG